MNLINIFKSKLYYKEFDVMANISDYFRNKRTSAVSFMKI